MKRIIDWLNNPITNATDREVKASIEAEAREIRAELAQLDQDEKKCRKSLGGMSSDDRAGFARQRRQLQGHLDWLARGGR